MISKKKSIMSEFSQHQTIFVLFSFVISFTIIDKVAGSSFDLNADVKFLTDANFDDYAVASILLYRTPDQRKQINDAVGKARNDDKLIDEQTLEEVLNSEPLTNLWCTMFFDETALLASFFGEYFSRKDELSMAVVLIQVKDMDNFMKVYKEQYEADNFEARCQDQSELFRKLLKVWTEKSREPDPSGEVNHDDVMKDVEALKAEQPNWNTKTTQLEVILIKKPFKYASAVIAEFEKSLQNTPIEKTIQQNIKDKNISAAFSSLATFVKDKYKYMANLIHDQDYNTRTWWSSWVILLATNKPEDWKQIDTAFRKEYKNKALRKYILQTNTDHIFVESVAMLMDPSYKPSFLDDS